MLVCIESMFGEQVFSHYISRECQVNFTAKTKSSPLPEMNDRNVIYIQVPRRDSATRTDGVVFWIIWIVNSLLHSQRGA